MADPRVDCSRANALIVEIAHINRDIEDTRAEMERLGFGTAKLVRTIKAAYRLATALEALVPGIWSALISHVRCIDGPLATLTVAEMKKLLEVLVAHIEVLHEGAEDEARQRLAKKALDEARAKLAAWDDNQAQAAAIAILVALKKFIRDNAGWVIEALVEAYGADVANAAAKGLLSSPKTWIKLVVQRAVITAVGKKAAGSINPFVGVALTGWELLVEMAGGEQIQDLRDHADRLLVELVLLLVRCGWGWVQHNDPKMGPPGIFFRGETYNNATVSLRAFVRCAQLVDGKPRWSNPCPVRFDTGRPAKPVTLAKTLDRNNRSANGDWDFVARIDTASVNNAPCMQGAKYCYTFIEVTITFPNGKTTKQNVITGVKAF